jgi:hypothetical protein
VAGPQDRLADLAEGVLGPLVLGGPMRLVPPLGPAGALGIGVGRTMPDDDLRSRVDLARVRTLRLLAPIDVLPPISSAEWALTGALNDLLQTTNHLLSGPLTRSRHGKLLAATSRLIAAIPAPATTLEVLTRHALFAGALRVARTDVTVANRVTRSTFRGEQPPKRLYYWKQLRGVSEDRRKVPIGELSEGTPVDAPSFLGVLQEWLARAPHSAHGAVTRLAPVFAWSPASAALVSYPIGRTLALRALARLPEQAVVLALQRASDRVPPGTEVRAIAERFLDVFMGRSAPLGPGSGTAR